MTNSAHRYYVRSPDGDKGGPTAASAGLGDLGQVRLLAAPHTSENFLQQEMGYQIARKHAAELRRVTIWGGCAAPLAFTLAAIALGAAAGRRRFVRCWRRRWRARAW